MKLWVVFEKCERLRFIGHLDLLRAMQRAIARARVPAAYSKGYNPHSVINFAAPLSLGMPGENELVEIKLDEGQKVFDEADMSDALSRALPAALRLVSTRLLPDTHPSPMALLRAAEYSIDLRRNPELLERVPDFYAQTAIPAVRKTKTGDKPCDIRPMMSDLAVQDGWVTVTLALCEQQTCKPALFLDALAAFAGVPAPEPMIVRKQMLGQDATGALRPLHTL